MIKKEEITAAFEEYIKLYPEEKDNLRHYRDFIYSFDDEMLFNRKNFVGHITASGIILDSDKSRMLMLDHVQLKKWLQPGGHVDATDKSVLAAALREIKEETGIDVDNLVKLRFEGDGPEIIDIDSHYIPPSQKKNEDDHYHHDVRYLFMVKNNDCELSVDYDESAAARWFSLDEIPSYWGFDRIKHKLLMYR